MNFDKFIRVAVVSLSAMVQQLDAAWTAPEYRFPGPAGTESSDAVVFDSPLISGWASGVATIDYGDNLSDEWMQPLRALGPVQGFGSTEDVVSLGEGGSITLTFDAPVANGEGWDFAVFENSFNGRFLELAFVEVSSDGENFVRFPSYSVTASTVGEFGWLDTQAVYGLAGKYENGYGTPFDIQDLLDLWAVTDLPESRISEAYREHLHAAMPFLDPLRISHVRVVDVVGDGRHLDAEGYPIYDPYETNISAGFDLNGVGVRHFLTLGLWSEHFNFSPELKVTAAADGIRVSVELPDWVDSAELYMSPDLAEWEVVQLTASDVTSDGLRLWTVALQHRPALFLQWTAP